MSDTQREELLITPSEFSLAESIARQVAPKWTGVDVDDVIAGLYLWLVEHHGYVVEYRTAEGGKGKLNTALTREAHAVCAKEYRHAHHLADQSWYTAKQVERLLPHAWDTSEWPQSSTFTDTYSDVSETVITMLGDVSLGLRKLPDEDRQILEWKYRLDNTYADIGTRLGISKEAARKRVSRAVERLHYLLGGDKADPAPRWKGNYAD